MSREMWYLTKGSGIVAAVLIVAALLVGFLFSARETGRRLRPNWWLDLHNWLGGLALVFTGIHIGASLLDTNSGIGLKQVVVPGAAVDDPWGITWGVLATYIFVVVVFTTWPRRLKVRWLWRILHLTSVAGIAFALIHSYQSGSDSTQLVFRVGLIAATIFATYTAALRLVGSITNRLGHKDSQLTPRTLSSDSKSEHAK